MAMFCRTLTQWGDAVTREDTKSKQKRKDTVVSLEPACAQVCAMKCGGGPAQPTYTTSPTSYFQHATSNFQLPTASNFSYLLLLTSNFF